MKMLLVTFLSICVGIMANSRLIEIGQSPYQWNGVALTKTNRIFAAFPRVYENYTLSVAELLPNKVLKPIPGGEWNTFNAINSSSNPETRFVSIHAILTDSEDNLWVVDDGTINDYTYPNGPKLVKINTKNNSIARIYSMSSLNVTTKFVLNDVRVGSKYAYLTEFGYGSVVVVNLQTGQVRRVLYNSSSTKFADPTVVRFEGRVVLGKDGQPKRVNNDQIELSLDEKLLYYKPAFAYNWFQVETKYLLDESLTEAALDQKVQTSWNAMPTSGSTMDKNGFIYMMDNERAAIWKLCTTDGTWQLIVQDNRIVWGDAADISTDGYLYVPMSQINRIPASNNGTDYVQKPFRMYKIKIY